MYFCLPPEKHTQKGNVLLELLEFYKGKVIKNPRDIGSSKLPKFLSFFDFLLSEFPSFLSLSKLVLPFESFFSFLEDCFEIF